MLRRLVYAAPLLIVSLPVSAQTARPQRNSKERLRFTLILSRHGIRPPLTAAATLNDRTSDPWPGWPVPLGHLTPHGAEALRQVGTYMREDFATTGLFSSAKCPSAKEVYLYADTDQRNVASTRATFDAFAPNCEPLPIFTWLPPKSPEPGNASPSAMTASRDPIFVPIGGHAFPPPTPDVSLAALRSALKNAEASLGTPANPELLDLVHILTPDPRSHPAAKPVLDEPVSFTANPSGDPMITAHGPLAAASSLVEDLLLEYIDGKTLAEVGWGRVGASNSAAEAALHHLDPLHIRAFGYAHRTPFFARAENSNLLAHILDTLQQAAGTPASPAASLVPIAAARLDTSINPNPSPTAEALSGPDPDKVKRQAKRPSTVSPHIQKSPETRINGAFGPAGTRLVYISAHDTNLFGIAGLLGLHWTVDGVADDTPPDSQLIFELWQKPHKLKKGETPDSYPFTLRVRYRAQTFAQLRAAAPLTAATPPAEVDLKPVGCKSSRGCDLPVFLHAARATIDPAYTQLDVPPTQLNTE